MNNREHVGVLVLAVAVSLGAVGLALISSSGELKQKDVTTSAGHTSSYASAEQDEDGDGLLAWKELLLGTNPNIADSDGDGISDGDEVAMKENPLAVGSPSSDSTSYQAPRGLPTTEAVARELFVEYATLRSSGELSGSQTASALSDIIDRHVSVAGEVRIYTMSDLKTEDDVSVVAYEGAVTAALRESLVVREYELNVFARAISNKSSYELKKLEVTAQVYDKIRDQLLALEVPARAQDEHLAVVNDMTALTGSVRDLARWGGDPLDALALVNAFAEQEKKFTDSLSDLYSYTAVLKKL